MLGFVRWRSEGRRDSPVCAVCPAVSAAYSGRHWRSCRRGDARPGADWQPAEHLWLQAPVTTANPPWNWTQGRIFNTRITGMKVFIKVSPAGPVLTVSEELQLLRQRPLAHPLPQRWQHGRQALPPVLHTNAHTSLHFAMLSFSALISERQLKEAVKKQHVHSMFAKLA